MCFGTSGMVIVLFLVLSFIANPASLRAETAAAVLDKAKAEGKVVWYVSVDLPVAQAVARGFEKKYPSLKVEIFRNSSESQLTRVLAEFTNKRYIPDVISMNVMNTHLVKSKGVLAKYFSPEAKAYAEGFKDPEGYWVSDHFNGYVVAYNTKMIAPADAPKTWDDLLSPRFRGKIMFDSTKAQWFIAQLDRMGQEKGMEYMRKLAAQKTIPRRGLTQIVQLMAAGEAPVSLFSNLARVEEMRKKGAPVVAAQVQPMIGSVDCSAIAAQAPRPNAAKVFIDYILTRDAQIIIAENHNLPTLPKTPGPDSAILSNYEIYPTAPVDPETYKKMFDLYRRTFNF